MRHVIESRNPLTRDEVLAYLNQKVEREEEHWGKDYIYTQWAREARDKKMKDFDEGKVVSVWTEDFVDSYGSGTGNYSDTLYSDGHVETACYGSYD